MNNQNAGPPTPNPSPPEGRGEPEEALAAYFSDLHQAPVPARLLAETPPQAMLRKLTVNLSYAALAMGLVLIVANLPDGSDERKASQVAQQITYRVALRDRVTP